MVIICKLLNLTMKNKIFEVWIYKWNQEEGKKGNSLNEESHFVIIFQLAYLLHTCFTRSCNFIDKSHCQSRIQKRNLETCRNFEILIFLKMGSSFNPIVSDLDKTPNEEFLPAIMKPHPLLIDHVSFVTEMQILILFVI